MTQHPPVDLAAQAHDSHPAPIRWAVVWWVDRVPREAYFADRALADAYAAAHHGQVVPLAALRAWPSL